MAASRPCAERPSCAHASAAPGVQQTLDEMDFERGEAREVVGLRRLTGRWPQARPGPAGEGGGGLAAPASVRARRGPELGL